MSVPPTAVAPQDSLALQASIGNKAVQRLLLKRRQQQDGERGAPSAADLVRPEATSVVQRQSLDRRSSWPAKGTASIRKEIAKVNSAG